MPSVRLMIPSTALRSIAKVVLTLIILLAILSQSARANDARMMRRLELLHRLFGVHEEVTFVRKLPDEVVMFDEEGNTSPLVIGYRYDYFSVLGMSLWNWGGEFVLTSGSGYSADKETLQTILTKFEISDLSVPKRYYFPTGLIVIGGGVLLLITRTSTRKPSPAQRARKLLQDPLYAEIADDIEEQFEAKKNEKDAETDNLNPSRIYENFSDNDSPVFKSSVDKLVEEGVDLEEAEDNVSIILDYLQFQEELKDLSS